MPNSPFVCCDDFRTPYNRQYRQPLLQRTILSAYLTTYNTLSLPYNIQYSQPLLQHILIPASLIYISFPLLFDHLRNVPTNLGVIVIYSHDVVYRKSDYKIDQVTNHCIAKSFSKIILTCTDRSQHSFQYYYKCM